MQIVFFFALWLVIALGVPAIVHVVFGSSECLYRSQSCSPSLVALSSPP